MPASQWHCPDNPGDFVRQSDGRKARRPAVEELIGPLKVSSDFVQSLNVIDLRNQHTEHHSGRRWNTAIGTTNSDLNELRQISKALGNNNSELGKMALTA